MREMKDSGVEWIGEIPTSWNVFRNKNAFVCSKELVGEKSSETQLLSLTTKGIKLKDINNAEGKLPESFDTYQYVKENELVMCLFDLDCSAVFSGISPYAGMISPAYRVLTCTDRMFPKYADYWFQYISHGRKFNHYAKNIRYTLSYEEFSALPMLFPNIEEQKRISDYLDSKCAKIDSIIEKQQTIIEKLKEYKLSVITEAVTKGLNPDAEMKDSGIDSIGHIPASWTVGKTLYALSMPITDGPHETPELYDEGIPFVSAEAVSCGNGVIDFDHIRGYISKAFYEECCKKYVPQMNDIYMIKSGATTGKVAIVDTDKIFTIWSPLGVFRCNPDKMYYMYLYYFLQSDTYQKQVQDKWTFGTQQNIGMRSLEKLMICFPSIEEQKEIAEYIYSQCRMIEKNISTKQVIVEKLKEYKKSLIYEVVTGKKEV